jgi:hypothetical protein
MLKDYLEFLFLIISSGNISTPNTFSNNLLDNIAQLQGIKPYIRVGGNTQDFVIYNPDLPVGFKGVINESRSPDYPSYIEIGDKFFESFLTWPDTKFSFGLNFGGNNDSRAYSSTLKIAPLLCKTLGVSRFWGLEYGNEADQYASRSYVRKGNWNESEYVAEWLNGTRAIQKEISRACPEFGTEAVSYLGPSFAGLNTHLRSPRAWAFGLNSDKTLKYFASHKYGCFLYTESNLVSGRANIFLAI